MGHIWLKILQAITYCIGKLPLSVLYFFSTFFLYPLTYYVVRYRRKIVQKNLTLSFPEYSDSERKDLEKRFYRHFVDLLAEIIHGYAASDEEMAKRMIYDEKDKMMVEKLIEKYGGCFFMLSHFGNWEWEADLSKRFTNSKMHLVSVYRKLNSHVMDELMKSVRVKRGTTMCEMADLFRTMVRQSKEDRLYTYGMISDQKPSLFSQNYWTIFFHQKTAFLDGTERLARHFKYPVIYVHITSPQRGVYHNNFVVISEHPEQEEEFYITSQYAKLLKNNILESPHLWLWSHNRWKYKCPDDAIIRP